MPKEKWGTKRLCPSTGKRFYDLNRDPIISPYTGEEVDIDSAQNKLTGAVVARDEPKKKASSALSADIESANDLIEDDASDGADLDEDLLDDDDDDSVSLDDLADVASNDE